VRSDNTDGFPNWHAKDARQRESDGCNPGLRKLRRTARRFDSDLNWPLLFCCLNPQVEVLPATQ
jgi:hypothetical protein